MTNTNKTTKQAITFATRIETLEAQQVMLVDSLEKFASVIASVQTVQVSQQTQVAEIAARYDAMQSECELVDNAKFLASIDAIDNKLDVPKYTLPTKGHAKKPVVTTPKSTSPQGHPCCGTGGNERHAINCVNRVPTKGHAKGFDTNRKSNDPWQQAIIDAAVHVGTNSKRKFFNVNIRPLCPNDARHYLTTSQHKAFRQARDNAGIRPTDAAKQLTQYVQQ